MINPYDLLIDIFHMSDTAEFEIYFVLFQLIRYPKIIPPYQFGGICKLMINHFIGESIHRKCVCSNILCVFIIQ